VTEAISVVPTGLIESTGSGKAGGSSLRDGSSRLEGNLDGSENIASTFPFASKVGSIFRLEGPSLLLMRDSLTVPGEGSRRYGDVFVSAVSAEEETRVPEVASVGGVITVA
jgi:hypothetical protein